MQKELPVQILCVGASWLSCRAMVIAASSPLLMVWRSSWDWNEMYVVVSCLGSTTAAPSVGLPATMEPSVYRKESGSHLRMCVWMSNGVCGSGGVGQIGVG